MATIPAAEITKMVKQGYVPSYYRSLWNKITKAYGGDDSIGMQPSFDTERFPDFPDITPRFAHVGQSMKIQNVQILMAAELLSTAPEPEFPDLDPWTKSVRQQYIRDRSHGGGDVDAEWSIQHACVHLEGEGLGVGVAYVGLVENSDGTKQVDVRHHPITQTLWDPTVRTITRARWVCVMHYMSLVDAELFLEACGIDAAQAKSHVKKIYETQEYEDALEVVRIFEFWHAGIPKKWEPTRAIIIDDITNEPCHVEVNPYGRLPFAFYEGFVLPGMRRSAGRIATLISDQAAINEAENSIRASTRKIDFDLIDPTGVEQNDLKNVLAGIPGSNVRTKGPIDGKNLPIQRVSGGTYNPGLDRWLDRKESEFTANAGISEARRAQFSPTPRTLGENLLVDEKSNKSINFAGVNLARYYRRLYYLVCIIGAMADTAPLKINIEGRKTTLNTGEFSRNLDQYLAERTRVVIDVESLTSNDVLREVMQKKAALMAYMPFVQIGKVSVKWLLEELLKLDSYDPDEVLQDQEQEANVADPNGMQDPAAMMNDD